MSKSTASSKYPDDDIDHMRILQDVDEVNKYIRTGEWQLISFGKVGIFKVKNGRWTHTDVIAYTIGHKKVRSVIKRVSELEQLSQLLEEEIANLKDWKHIREKDFQDIESLAEEIREYDQYQENGR